MKTKVLSIILAAALLISVCAVLAACGNDAKTDPTAATQAAATAATTAPAANNNSGSNTGNNTGSNNSGSNSGAADTGNADGSADGNTPADTGEGDTGATSAPYYGDTVITADQAIDFVKSAYSYGEGFSYTETGCLQIPDGSVWHNVQVFDENGEMVASYYVSDTTGSIMTVNELNAYAYR